MNYAIVDKLMKCYNGVEIPKIGLGVFLMKDEMN